MPSYRIAVSLPPSANHQYVQLRNGGKALTTAALRWRNEAWIATVSARFEPSLKATYGVYIWFYVPTWNSDIDGRIKLLLDAVFGSRMDQRIVVMTVRKIVQKQTGVVMRVRTL